MYIGAKEVTYFEGYKLIITFENNEKKIFDVSPYLENGNFKELKDKKLFKTVHISFDTIEWNNGLDLDPELLYTNSTPYTPSAV